jgi:indole-3-glycerol phosphate synthase
MNKLQEIARNRRSAIEAEMAERPLEEVQEAAVSAPPCRGFRDALVRGAPAVIAEIKRASPSAGSIRADADAPDIAARYQAAGAAALSVLTEPDYFGGALADMLAARAATNIPVIRKDFIVEPWQIHESRAAGADAVLLIVALLGEKLEAYLSIAREAGIDALVEVHDEAELEVALAAGADLVGVNNRDLRDLTIDLAVTERLAPHLPAHVALVAESGIKTRDDAKRMIDAGASALLVGSSLMASEDPGNALRTLLGKDSPDRANVDKDLRNHAA